MPRFDRLDRRFEAATRELDTAPVRWSRVAALSRRRGLLAFLLLVLAAVAITIVVASGVLAGKAALDPKFDPPIFSRSKAAVEFDEPPLGRGLTTLAGFLEDIGQPPSDADQVPAQTQGYVLKASIQPGPYAEETLEATWQINPARSTDEGLQVPIYPDMSVVEPDRAESPTLRAWIKAPDQSGRYVVDFSLRSESGDVVIEDRSDPFVVLADNFFAPYRAPTYSALIPKNWDKRSDYAPKGGRRYVTEAVGSGGISVVVDTTLNMNGDPARSARTLEDDIPANRNYDRLKFRRAKLRGGKVFEWSYELDGRAYTDILFYRGGDGFGVVADGPPDRISEIRTVAREVARSIEVHR